MRTRRLTQAGLAAIALGSLLVLSLPPHAYTTDLQQEYLSAWALRDGVDLFTPINELAARHFLVPTDTFPHPSPHPPLLALVSLPLTVLPFPVVVVLWLAVNLLLLVQVGRWLGVAPQTSLALTAWPPLWCVLHTGNLEVLLLTLALLGWRAAAAGRDAHAGVWFGVAVVLKLYPVFLLAPFAARRRSRLILVAGAVIAAGQLVNLATVGSAGIVRYYGEILPGVAARYAPLALNTSLHGELLRLFGGAADVSPILHAPAVVLPVTIMLGLGALVALLRLDPEASPVAGLVGLPVVWSQYAILAVGQIGTLLRSPFRRPTIVAVAALSCILPLANLLVQWGARLACPVAILRPAQTVLLALPSMGMVLLLGLALAQSRTPAVGR